MARIALVSASVPPDVTITSVNRIEVEAMPATVMGGDRLPQFRKPHHRGVLIVAIHHRIGRGAANVFRAGIVRKTLAEIDCVVVARELPHRLENSHGKIREDLVHGGHETVSRRPWSAVPRPSSPACRPRGACRS